MVRATAKVKDDPEDDETNNRNNLDRAGSPLASGKEKNLGGR